MAGKVTSFALRALERIEPCEERFAIAIAGVTIFGLDQLDPATQGSGHFIERWRAAMSFQLGAEEFEKFCLGQDKHKRRHI
jgi:hypothetical protein